MKVNLITSELIVQARAALQRFIEGKGRLCIPAQPTDDDMLLSEALDRLQVLSDPGHALVAVASSDAPRWTPIRQALPDQHEWYLVVQQKPGEYHRFCRLFIVGEGWQDAKEEKYGKITHWMPLPPVPEGMEWK